VKRTVCNAQTETSSVTSSQKVVFKRHCGGFADSRASATLGVPILITPLEVLSPLGLRRRGGKKSSPTCSQLRVFYDFSWELRQEPSVAQIRVHMSGNGLSRDYSCLVAKGRVIRPADAQRERKSPTRPFAVDRY
jgi:hypothetical protein